MTKKMPKTKTNKQDHMTAAEVKDKMAEEADRKIDMECAKELEEVLKKHSRALQPYIVRNEFVTAPRVRLIRVQPKDNAEEAD